MDRKEYKRINDAFLDGELIFGIKYRHNSEVRVTDDKGNKVIGWIVGLDTNGREPIYTIEISGGDPNYEVKESEIELIHDPHI